MGFFDDIADFGNGLSKQFDNLAGTNLSGRGGGELANLSERYNRSDIGRWTGGLATSGARTITKSVTAASDLLRGDVKQAGRSLGQAAGGYANFITLNSQQLVNDNRQAFKNAGSWTLGITDDLAGVASGLRSQEDQAYVSDADRNSAIRFAGKGVAIGAAVAYAPAIYGAAAANPLTSLTVAGLATQGPKGQAAAAKILTGNILPPEWQEPVNRGIDQVINPPTSNPQDPTEFGPWKNDALPGTAYVSSPPNQLNGYGGGSGGGANIGLLIAGGAALIAVIMIARKK